MAGLAFHYYPGESPLHEMDARVKLCALMGVALSVFSSDVPGLMLLSILLALGITITRLPISPVLRQMRTFGVLILAIVIIRAFSFRPPHFSLNGLHEGAVYGWRLILVVISAVIFISTTKTTETRDAIVWMLKPFPESFRAKTAAMISLTLSFVPTVFDQASIIRLAQKSRGIDSVKNPIKKLSAYGVPLAIRTFSKADNVVRAMQARCYGYQLPVTIRRAGKNELFFVLLITAVCVISVFGSSLYG
jgi:energy-coupling factor transporter transmembrane protein EcfT